MRGDADSLLVEMLAQRYESANRMLDARCSLPADVKEFDQLAVVDINQAKF